MYFKRKKRLVIYEVPIVDNSGEIPRKKKIGFTGIKVFLLSIIPPFLLMFSFYLIGWLKNLNHPWYADPFPYLINAFLFLLIGLWLSIHLSKIFSLSKCPYAFFLRSTLILIIFTLVLSYFDVRVAIYPAISLLMICFASIIKNQFVKIILLVLSPLPILRLIFNEWFYFTLRVFVSHRVEFTGRHTDLFVHIAIVVFFTIILLPYFFAFGSIYRESTIVQSLVKRFRSVKTFVFLIALAVLMNLYLYTQPSYNSLWQKNLMVKQTFDIEKNKFYVTLKSSEYLDSLKFQYRNKDTTINTNKTELILIEVDSIPIDLKKFMVETAANNITVENDSLDDDSLDNDSIKPHKQKRKSENNFKQVSYTGEEGEKTNLLFSIETYFEPKHSPYKVDIRLYGKSYIFREIYIYKEESEVDIELSRSLRDKGDSHQELLINYYSFPSVPFGLVIYFNLGIKIFDPLEQEIKMIYNYPLYPIKVEKPNTNVIFRSEIIRRDVF